ncbi:MAG: ATP-binding domain-containing protein [Myxacorys californica WJT36-NPBG1]|jgi:superfamily I DNA/RNA helicase|nr:ATP-binding domain-containing protein [Myxacorys californica WJT36-NPBG1]
MSCNVLLYDQLIVQVSLGQMTWMRTFGRYRFQRMKMRIHRAKGHEAKFVYIDGLERAAEQEDNLLLRNQLFVALTRSQAWVHLSGITDPGTPSDYLFYDEVRRGAL